MASSDQNSDIQIQDAQKPSSFQSGVKVQTKPIGSSGTEIYGGYFSEEYLQSLRGRRGAKIWDEMRRSESQVSMLLSAIQNPIKSANWDFESPSDVSGGELHADFCKMVFNEMLDWEATLHEMLTFIPFGFSLFEVIHNVVFNHPKFGTINGLRALAFRSQKTIESWQLEPQTGKLLSVRQFVFSDVSATSNVDIPGEFLVCFSLNKEGDNYEGVSALRPMYGAWFRKNLYLKLVAIGVEKYAVGTPIGTVPKGQEESDDLAKFKTILENYTSHESAYVLKPEGWEIEIQKTDFDASKIKEIILLENTEMVNAVVANFLALGMSGAGGAFALGQDLSDFFLSGLQQYANIICGVFNRKLIPHLINLNYGPQAAYPKLKCTGIDDKAGKELAEIIGVFIDKKAIKPDDKLDEYLRRLYKLPAADSATAREVSAPANPNFGAQSPALDEKTTEIELAETDTEKKNSNEFTKLLDNDAQDLRKLMQVELAKIYNEIKAGLVESYKKAPDADKIKVGTQLIKPDLSEYQNKLKEFLGKVAAKNLGMAQKEIGVKSAKLAEYADTIKLASDDDANLVSGFYDALPPAIKKIVHAQALLVSDSQEADTEKVVSFQYTSSSTATTDIAQISADIDEAIAKVLAGSRQSGMSIDAAAANTVSQVANQTRTEFFFEPNVLDEIESWTFENNDPVSEICSELAGKTFAANDPRVDEFTPPLHHNCKSRMVPNLKGTKGPAVDEISVSDSARKSITL